MATPRFSTLCAQAQKIVKSDLKLAANFFASGMAFRLREPSGYDLEGLRDILKDVACYEDYLECSVRKSKYQQELLEQLKQNPTAYHKLFNEGYLYECDILSKQEEKTAQQTTEEQDIEKPRVGLFRVKGGYIYSAIPNAVAESAIIEISYRSYCLFAEDNSPRAMIIMDNANHVYLMRYHKRYSEGLGAPVFSCFEHFDYTELYEDLECSSNNKMALLVYLRDDKYGMIAVENKEDGRTKVVVRIPCVYDTMEEVENEILKMMNWDMNQPKPFCWVDNIYTTQEALKDDDGLSDCIKDMLRGEYKPSERITFPENLSHESSAEDLCKAMWSNEDFKNEVLKEYKRIMALKAFLEDESGPDGGPSEDVVQAARDAYGIRVDDLTLLDDDEPLD
jgi:hypothetical protein